MATYQELFGILNNSELRNKITVAVGVAADTIWAEDAGTENHANRLLWAKAAYENPQRAAEQIMWSVIIANRGQSVANILAAPDAAIQTNVDAVVNLFATGE